MAQRWILRMGPTAIVLPLTIRVVDELIGAPEGLPELVFTDRDGAYGLKAVIAVDLGEWACVGPRGGRSGAVLGPAARPGKHRV